MNIRPADGRSVFLDFREKAPLAATANMYLDKDGNITGFAMRIAGQSILATVASVTFTRPIWPRKYSWNR